MPGCACRGAFQFAVMERLSKRGERFDLVAGASSGSICGAVTVAGLSGEGPSMWRSFMSTPVVSARYLPTEKSIFGMSVILRDALTRFLPEERLHNTETELLVATTRAKRFAMGARDALVVHSNKARRDMHDIIVASCYIPIVYARVPVIDGEVHIDGGAADNTLIDSLVERGAKEITLVTPYPEGAVAQTVFAQERTPHPRKNVRIRLIFPERRLSQKRFDFTPGPLEEALAMPHVERVLEL